MIILFSQLKLDVHVDMRILQLQFIRKLIKATAHNSNLQYIVNTQGISSYIHFWPYTANYVQWETS